jgi:hypothetical protein
MRRVFASVVIQPVQALDSGLVRPRALLTLDLGALLPPKAQTPRPPRETRQVDLFDPPVHIKHMSAIVALKREKIEARQKASLSVLAAALKVNRMTVKRALAYDKLMSAAGLTEPYRVLHKAPAAASRWKPSRRRLQNAATTPRAA